MTETTQAQRVRWASIYFVAVIAAYMAVILAAKNPPPFVDYPNWVYQGVLFHGAMAGHSFPGYVLKHYPVPNSTTTIGLGLLNFVMPWHWAGKVWICLYLVLAAAATRYLSRATGREEWLPLLAFPGVVFLNLDFWYGFSNFEIGVCLVMFLLGMLLRGVSTKWIALLMVAIFFTHMEACACGFLLLMVWWWETRRPKLLLACVPALLLTMWYAIGRFTSGNVDAGPERYSHAYGSLAFLIFKVNTYFKVFGFVNASDMKELSITANIFGRALYLIVILAAIVISLAGFVLIIRFLAKAPKDSNHKAVRVVVGSLLAISLVLPKLVLGTEDPGARILLMAIALVMFFLPWRSTAGRVFAALSVFFCLVNLWQFAVVSRNPRMDGVDMGLPRAMKNAYLKPAGALVYYESLEKGTMDQPIFWTAMFSEGKR